MIYDSHIHQKHHEDGGFIIALEGEPHFDGVYNNEEALALHNPEKNYYAFYYVSFEEVNKKLNHPLLKIHPRREKYNPKEVSDCIRINKPKAVIVDTLNEPYWNAYDYWYLAKEHENIPFIFAHAGGYIINEFIKICQYQKNVWIDFSFTHTRFGCLGDNEIGLLYVNDAIKYSLKSKFNDRIFLGTDFPFFDQDDVFKYYKDYQDLLNRNYINFSEKYLK